MTENTNDVCCTLDMAHQANCLTEAVVVGVDADGKLQIYTACANKERIICLLERAKFSLLQQMFKATITT